MHSPNLILKINSKKFGKIMPTGPTFLYFCDRPNLCASPSPSAPFAGREKSALGLARFSGPSYSHLQPFFGRLGLGGRFAYYMEGRWQGHRQETVHDLGTV